MSEVNKPDLTEADAIKAARMVAGGATWREVVDEIYPGTEYPELLEVLTANRVRHWYKRQTPDYLMEVLKV